MNKYINYIDDMIKDIEAKGVLSKEDTNNLIKGFKTKLSLWLMEQPRASNDIDFVEMTDAIKYIKEDLKI